MFEKVLPKDAKDSLASISAKNILPQKTYLAGGTALALQIKHRQSVDFDVFINRPVTNSLRLKVKKIFGSVDYSLNTSDQISFTTPDNIKITFDVQDDRVKPGMSLSANIIIDFKQDVLALSTTSKKFRHSV